ncbi:MAG: stage V sporulation protein B [Bacillota bacterium]
MSSRSFIYGTAVLLAASLFNRSIGFIYQIMMMRLIKPEGVGLFSMIFPIYVMLLVVASLGIPVAISKLVAEEVAVDNLPGAYRVFKISLAIIIVSAILIASLLFFGSPLLIKYLFPNPKVYLCFVTLVPGILIVSVCSAFRGFFQGLQRMSPTAITQAVEQLVRVTAGLSIAWFLLPRGVEYASVGISLGVICGEFMGFLFMLYIYLTRRPHYKRKSFVSPEPYRETLRRIFSMGIPVTLTRFTSTALMSADALIIPRRLQHAGMSLSDATSTYGQFVGIAEALFYTPGVVTVALATALIPAVSDAVAQGKIYLVRSRIEDAVRITLLLGCLVASIFFVLPRELSQVLFGYGSAGGALFILALSGPFLYLQQTVNGVLQGLGRPDIPFKNLLKASVVKVLGIYYLTSIPGFGIQGTALALGLTYIIMCILNYHALNKLTNLRIDMSSCVLKPALSAAAAGAVMFQLKNLFSSITSGFSMLFICLGAGLGAYLLILYIIGGISSSDIRRMKMILKQNK